MPEDRRAATATLPDRIAFLGLGLIGGSVAMALRAAGYAGRLVAWTPSGRGPAAALERGVVDEAAPSAERALQGADLVILAGPPLAVLDTLREVGPGAEAGLGAGATVTDVASTKAAIVAAASARGLPFVGGHPMAGREATGVEAATADLFLDRPWVIVPAAAATGRDVARVEALAAATGARAMRLAPETHDEAVAGISHLPLVLAAALVEAVAIADPGAPTWPTARTLAASGWRDMTRLAMGDPEMGAGMLATNAPAVAQRLRAVRAALDGWIERLEAGDGPDGGPGAHELRSRLQAAREALTRETS